MQMTDKGDCRPGSGRNQAGRGLMETGRWRVMERGKGALIFFYFRINLRVTTKICLIFWKVCEDKKVVEEEEVKGERGREEDTEGGGGRGGGK